jgi:hypothetical protein
VKQSVPFWLQTVDNFNKANVKRAVTFWLDTWHRFILGLNRRLGTMGGGIGGLLNVNIVCAKVWCIGVAIRVPCINYTASGCWLHFLKLPQAFSTWRNIFFYVFILLRDCGSRSLLSSCSKLVLTWWPALNSYLLFILNSIKFVLTLSFKVIGSIWHVNLCFV